MRRATPVTLAPLLLALACSDPGATRPTPSDPAPTPPDIGRSPDEAAATDEPPPTTELSGGTLAAQHTAAVRLLDTEPARAAAMLETGCDRGFAASCVALADLLERGAPGVDADLDRANGLYEQACFDGSTIACDRLGH